MAISAATAADMQYAALDNFMKPSTPKSILKHIQKRPLLRVLESKQKPFGSGKTNVSEPVQGALMKDQAGFFSGWSQDDVVSFTASGGVVQAQYPWRNQHAGLKINYDELKADGVHVVRGNVKSDPDEKTRLVDLYETRLADFGESYAFSKNQMLWLDGTQDAKAIPGIKSIITDDPAGGTLGGIPRANVWWRHISRVGANKVAYNRENQTLIQQLTKDSRQLTRYGGAPDVWLAGSDFLDMLEREARYKGTYTQNGWEDKATGLTIKGLRVGNLGEILYDPTLDDLDEADRCYAFDSEHVKLRPMRNEIDKVTDHESPHDQFVFLQSMTYTGAMSCNQADCNAVWQAA